MGHARPSWARGLNAANDDDLQLPASLHAWEAPTDVGVVLVGSDDTE